MARVAIEPFVMIAMVVCAYTADLTALQGAAAAGGQYKVVKACSLLTAAEVKKLAPWNPILDRMQPEEEALGNYGSSCNYPSVHVQVMSFRQDTIDALAKDTKLEPVSGVGDAAWARNNRDRYAELLVKIGGHLLTVQLNIPTGQTFETSKPSLLELGKAFAAKLR